MSHISLMKSSTLFKSHIGLRYNSLTISKTLKYAFGETFPSNPSNIPEEYNHQDHC